jgi:hypothetical protein
MHKTSTSIFHSTGAILTSLLSCAACPACLPIYAGLLSLLGIELFEVSLYFFPLMLGSLGFTLALMARQVFFRKADYRPLLISVAAAGIIVWAAVVGQELPLYLSLAAFMGSIFWNKALLKKTACEGSCSGKCSSHA